jgi:hypothetical protein
MRSIVTLIIFFTVVTSCKKVESTDSTSNVPIQEESIKFSTNLDTGIINVIDTLPLLITVSSKLPSGGLLFSIVSTWTDSSKQIFKIDTSLNSASLSLNIPGHNKYGNYSLSVTITSKSTVTNTSNKSIRIVNDPVSRFIGYKVAGNARQLGTDYWANVPVPIDFMVYKFQKPPIGRTHIGNAGNIVAGDFNNDGWIDIFAPGMAHAGTINVNTNFLIWNSAVKTFEEKNLFNDKSTSLSKSNAPRAVPVYLNADNYVDVVVFGYVDEGIDGDPPNPIQLVVSDGKGAYDVIKINTETPLFYHNGGDVGDVNGDKIPDLVINCGGMMRILWGTATSPFFNENSGATFSIPINNLSGGAQVFYKNDNGFGETCIECVAQYIFNCRIYDINKDGLNDLVLSGQDEDVSPNRILINKGNGKFNISSIIKLPNNIIQGVPTKNLDYIIEDINSDGRTDVISLNTNWNHSKWIFLPYIQQSNGSFLIDKSFIVNNFSRTSTGDVSREKLIHTDINGDGQKDILEMNDMNQLKDKTVFIKSGNRYIETPFFQFDPYAKSLIK